MMHFLLRTIKARWDCNLCKTLVYDGSLVPFLYIDSVKMHRSLLSSTHAIMCSFPFAMLKEKRSNSTTWYKCYYTCHAQRKKEDATWKRYKLWYITIVHHMKIVSVVSVHVSARIIEEISRSILYSQGPDVFAQMISGDQWRLLKTTSRFFFMP